MGTGSAPSHGAGEIQDAINSIVAWSTRDGHQETMRRARCDLSPGLVALLVRIARSGPLRMSELAMALGVDNSTLTPQAQRLERDGLVSRVADPRDRRATLVRATRDGRALLVRLHRVRSALLDEILIDWAAEDRAQAVARLSRLATDLDRWTSERAPGTSGRGAALADVPPGFGCARAGPTPDTWQKPTK